MSGPVLVVLAAPAGTIDRPSLEALTIASQISAAIGAPLQELVVADGAAMPAAQLRSPGIASALVVDHPELTMDHPDGWAAVLSWLIETREPVAVVGAGTERGNELFARAAARSGLPFAANCTAVEPGTDGYELTRQRWAGSLLEDARLDAPVKLLTVAPNTVPPANLGSLGSDPSPIETLAPSLTAADLRLKVTGREAPERGKVS